MEGMQEQIKNFVNKYLTIWNELEKQKKVRLSLSVLALIISLTGAIYLATKPKMTTLLNNKDTTTISSAKSALDEAGIKSKVVNHGSGIEVRLKDEDSAWVAISKDPKLLSEKETYSYNDILSQMSISTTEETRRTLTRLAQQSELENALKNIDGIENATVILNIPEDITFLNNAPKTSASIILTTSKNIDDKIANSIANSVASSVKGLDVENVSIVDQYGDSIFMGGTKTKDENNKELELLKQRKMEIESSIISHLKPMFNDVKVTSNIKLNTNEISQTEKVWTNPVDEDSNKGLISTEKKSSSTLNGNAKMAEPGVASNDNVNTDYNAGDTSGNSGSTEDTDTEYLHNLTERTTNSHIGEIINDKSSIAVIVYKHKIYNETYMENNNLLNGLDWEEFKNQHSNQVALNLDNSLQENLIIGTGINNLSLIGYEIPIFIDAQEEHISWTEIALFAVLVVLIVMLAYGLIKKTKQEEEEILEVEPELSVEDLLVSTRLEEKKELESEMKNENLKDIGYINESESKKQIDKFVDEKPEAVAQLLRNWINDGWE